MNTAQNDKPEYRLHSTVALVGMMGSGKTAVGRSLAARLQVPFLDSDAALEEAAALNISEIFNRDGEAFFRAREAEVIQRLLSGPPAILSTGGGAFMNANTRQVIQDNATSVWLDADIATLWERVRYKDTRPLLRTSDPYRTLKALLDERTPIYSMASIRADIDPEATIEQTTDVVVQALAAHPEILEMTL